MQEHTQFGRPKLMWAWHVACMGNDNSIQIMWFKISISKTVWETDA
jgi:hypothetical protein